MMTAKCVFGDGFFSEAARVTFVFTLFNIFIYYLVYFSVNEFKF
uniref:Uncharacterized protein n=1 Tax=Manihot esculenta TaxID=3983 RepID=A0A2C9V6U0_MANES